MNKLHNGFCHCSNSSDVLLSIYVQATARSPSSCLQMYLIISNTPDTCVGTSPSADATARTLAVTTVFELSLSNWTLITSPSRLEVSPSLMFVWLGQNIKTSRNESWPDLSIGSDSKAISIKRLL